MGCSKREWRCRTYLTNIGSMYSKKGNYEKAIEYCKRCLIISKEIGAKEPIKNSYQVLSESYEKMGDIPKAYENYRLYTAIKDSIFNKESNEKLAELQTNFETEQKEKKIV